MASSTLLMFVTFLLFQSLFLFAAQAQNYPPMTLTVVNNCRFPIWPAIQPNAGGEVLERGGFVLPSLSHRSFPAPSHPWAGRIWTRTRCFDNGNDRLDCATGDCGGRLECGGLGGATPATLAQLSLHQSGPLDKVSYAVSLVDGFNLPMTVTPHQGRGVCPVVGCQADLLPSCPPSLQKEPGGVVGCKSGCGAFGTDELCCRNAYSSPPACRPSSYSQFFKSACPTTTTYAADVSSLPQDCACPLELKVIFCQ